MKEGDLISFSVESIGELFMNTENISKKIIFILSFILLSECEFVIATEYDVENVYYSDKSKGIKKTGLAVKKTFPLNIYERNSRSKNTGITALLPKKISSKAINKTSTTSAKAIQKTSSTSNINKHSK